MIFITEICIKHDFFKMISKERNFPWNIDIYGYMDIFFSKCRCFQIYLLLAKNDFFKVITKNVIFLEMLVFLEIWTKHVFFKMISKTLFSSKYWYSWHFRIYGQKPIFQKKNPFSRNVDTDILTKNDLFYLMSK